jgi:hypothetical protein
MGTETLTDTCETDAGSSDAGSPIPMNIGPVSIQLMFTEIGPQELTLTSTAGCVFDFTVSGTSATLSNGPVTCNVMDDGGVVDSTVTNYTLTLNNYRLTGTVEATATIGGTPCNVTWSLTALD